MPSQTYRGDRTGQAWTDEEDAFMREHYRRRGGKYCSRALGRAIGAIRNRAYELRIGRPKRREWVQAEDDYLRRHYAHATARELADELDRSEQAVRGRLLFLNMTVTVAKAWSAEELEFLKKNHKRMTIAEMAEHLGRTHGSVENKMAKAKISTRRWRPLTTKEIDFVVKHFGVLPFTVIAEKINSSTSTIRRIAESHGYRDRPTSRPWTTEDDARLLAIYGTMSRDDVARELGRTMLAVACRASALGLTRAVDRSKDRRWTGREIERLKLLAETCSFPEIARKLGRSLDSVRGKAVHLGVHPAVGGAPKSWSPSEDLKLARLARTFTPTAIASQLGRSEKAVQLRLKTLGLSNGWVRSERRRASGETEGRGVSSER